VGNIVIIAGLPNGESYAGTGSMPTFHGNEGSRNRPSRAALAALRVPNLRIQENTAFNFLRPAD